MRSTSAGTTSPRLALVLGSGGVRSIAAVGITEVLARHGIRPDLIVGCSSGALFGAVIASGMAHGEALRTASRLWSAELTEQRRWKAYAQMLVPRLAGFDADFALRDARLIAERLQQAFGALHIEDLPTPLRVGATDATTGQAVVLTRGRLTDALRASMALPILFPPVAVDGRRLVDGVLSDPLPVAAAADAQVLVTLGFAGSMPRRVDRPSRLVAQVTTTMINNLTQARLDAAARGGRGVLQLELALNRRVGLWETEAMPLLYEAGRRAAEARLAEIEALLDPATHCAAA